MNEHVLGAVLFMACLAGVFLLCAIFLALANLGGKK